MLDLKRVGEKLRNISTDVSCQVIPPLPRVNQYNGILNSVNNKLKKPKYCLVPDPTTGNQKEHVVLMTLLAET